MGPSSGAPGESPVNHKPAWASGEQGPGLGLGAEPASVCRGSLVWRAGLEASFLLPTTEVACGPGLGSGKEKVGTVLRTDLAALGPPGDPLLCPPVVHPLWSPCAWRCPPRSPAVPPDRASARLLGGSSRPCHSPAPLVGRERKHQSPLGRAELPETGPKDPVFAHPRRPGWLGLETLTPPSWSLLLALLWGREGACYSRPTG